MTTLIVEADGGSRGNPGPAAYGALVRAADSGEVLAEVGETIGIATNNVAEYRGLIAGLRMAHAIDPDATVEARLDSKLVVEQMSGRWKIKHPDMRPLALEAQRVFPPGRVTYTWVPRARNAHADRLLNDALDGKPTAAPSPADTGDEPPSTPPPSTGSLSTSTPTTGSAAGEASTPASAASVASQIPAPWATGSRAVDIGPPTTLVLVRHGQTEMTRAQVFSGGGRTGPQLDDVGRAQAKAAAELLASRFMPGSATGAAVADHAAAADDTAAASGAAALAGARVPGDNAPEPPIVVASPMRRTQETAAAIAAGLGSDQVVTDAEWRECGFGSWDGLTLAQITEQFPDEVARWFASPSYRPPGGESIEEMAERIAAARDRTVQRFRGRAVVVVTHSMPIRSLVRQALDAPTSAMFRLRPVPGSITEIQYYDDGSVTLAGFNLCP